MKKWSKLQKELYLIIDPKIDFLIEVKSSGYKSHASLDAFFRKFPERILHRYLVYTKDLRKDADIQMIPVFLTMFL